MDRETVRRNRYWLHSVPKWISDESYRHSRSGYGCPSHALAFLDLPIDDQPTYTDLLVHAAAHLPRRVAFLELGVSVGKNFYVLANVLDHASLYGFDREEINPVLAAQLDRIPDEGRLKRFRRGPNEVAYLQGDIARPEDWVPLSGMRFNLVFSDACHRPEILKREWEMIERHELLDADGFVIVWDDLDRQPTGAITRAFVEIGAGLRCRFRLPTEAMFRVQLNGWMGQHEHRHTIGVINSIGLTARSLIGVAGV